MFRTSNGSILSGKMYFHLNLTHPNTSSDPCNSSLESGLELPFVGYPTVGFHWYECMLMVCGISMNSAQGISMGADLQHCIDISIRVLVEHYLKRDIAKLVFNFNSNFRLKMTLHYSCFIQHPPTHPDK